MKAMTPLHPGRDTFWTWREPHCITERLSLAHALRRCSLAHCTDRSRAHIEIMNVKGGAKTTVGLTDDFPQDVDSLCQSGREREFQRQWCGLTISGFWQVSNQKAVDNNWMDFAICGVQQAVAAFDFRQETLGHEEALLLKGFWKHHIVPHWKAPAFRRG